MSTLTLQAAYQELTNNFAFYSNPTNRAALLNLAAQVDATNSTGAVTLAYSGQMNSGLHSSDVINTLKANKENVRLIDYTDAGKFLDSDDFLDAVAKSFDLTGFAELREAPPLTRSTNGCTTPPRAPGLWHRKSLSVPQRARSGASATVRTLPVYLEQPSCLRH